MNKFSVFSCIKVNENGYSGHCVVMSCARDPAFMLFFPVSEDNSKIISYVLDGNEDYDIDTAVLGLYKTMINSWILSDRYLSGIIMDSTYDEELDKDILMIRLALSNTEGDIDSLVRVNFMHAVLIAAMEHVHLIVSDDLITKMLPPEDPEEINDIFSTEGEEDFDDDEGGSLTVEKNKKDSQKGAKNTQKASYTPEDNKIFEIAKRIMSGNIKEKGDKSDKDKDEDKKK